MAGDEKRLAIVVEADVKDAEKKLDGLADTVEDLEKATPEVTVGADTSTAQGDLAKLEGDVKEVSGTKVVIQADASAVKKASKDVEAAGDTMNAQVGPLRDVSGAFGGTGTAALDAAEGITGFAETLQNLGGPLGSIGGKLAKGGFMAGIAAFAVTSGIEIANTVTGIGRKIMGTQDEVVASTIRANEDIIASTQKLVRQQGDMFEVADLFTDFGETVRFAGDKASRSIEDVDEALDRFKDNPAVMMKLIRAWEDATVGLDKNTDAYSENLSMLQRRKAELQNHMEATAAQAAADRDYAEAQDILNRAVEQGIDIHGRSADELRTVVEANDKRKESAETSTQAIKDQIDAERELRQNLSDSASALFGVQDKVRASKRAWWDYRDELKKVREDHKISETEFADMTDAIDDVAQSALDLKGDTADATNALKLMSTDDNLSPELKAYIAARIADLQRLQQEAADTVIAFNDVSQAATSPGGNRYFMAGGPVQNTGSYIVGEAGPERVVLPRGASVTNAYTTAARGDMSAGPSIQVTYNIAVAVASGAQAVDVGRETVNAIRAYERANGASWRK